MRLKTLTPDPPSVCVWTDKDVRLDRAPYPFPPRRPLLLNPSARPCSLSGDLKGPPAGPRPPDLSVLICLTLTLFASISYTESERQQQAARYTS